MRFKTCSYKSINILEKYSFVPISIEANPPNGTISKNLFRMLYIKQLDRCNDMSNLILKLLSYGGKICLVSSGGYNELNHRVILGEWLKRNGCNCKEYGVNKKKTQ